MKTSGILVAIAFAALPALANSQTAKASKKPETEAMLKAEAKITESVARGIALKEVPSGVVKSSEIEREKGHLVYSFDITVRAQTGIEEILVDAMTGKIISHEHETPKAEKAEARKEAKEKKASAKKK